MTDQLVKYLEEVCKSKGFVDALPSEDERHQSKTGAEREDKGDHGGKKDSKGPRDAGKSFLGTAKELLTSNTFKVDNHLDEVSYCKYLAS